MNKQAAHPLYRTRYLAILWPVLAVLGCVALWTATTMRGNAEMARAHAQALKEADAYAQAYQQYVTRSIAQMDQITMQLKHSWEHSAKPDFLENMRRDGTFTDDAFVIVSVVGPDGLVRSSTRAITPDASFAHTRFFHQHRNNNSTALRIGLAPAELHLGRAAVLFTRRLDTADDEFDGGLVDGAQGFADAVARVLGWRRSVCRGWIRFPANCSAWKRCCGGVTRRPA